VRLQGESVIIFKWWEEHSRAVPLLLQAARLALAEGSQVCLLSQGRAFS
jgi:hypothetical protein